MEKIHWVKVSSEWKVFFFCFVFYMNLAEGEFTYIQSFVTFAEDFYYLGFFFHYKLHPNIFSPLFLVCTQFGVLHLQSCNTIYFKRLDINFSSKETIYMTVKSSVYYSYTLKTIWWKSQKDQEVQDTGKRKSSFQFSAKCTSVQHHTLKLCEYTMK